MSECELSGSCRLFRSKCIVTPFPFNPSIGWLRLLHHCLMHCLEVQEQVAMAAAPIPHLLTTCTALLMSTSASVYAPNIEAVLLEIALYSPEMGLGLIDLVLGNTNPSVEDAGWCSIQSTNFDLLIDSMHESCVLHSG